MNLTVVARTSNAVFARDAVDRGVEVVCEHHDLTASKFRVVHSVPAAERATPLRVWTVTVAPKCTRLVCVAHRPRFAVRDVALEVYEVWVSWIGRKHLVTRRTVCVSSTRSDI